jgi:peptidoglycan/xylan/chitin deacetylase (PgdA/CDA1 family)
MEKNPDEVIYAIKNGFLIGNHSYNHPNFSEISLDECYQQIKKTDDLINSFYKETNIIRKYKLFRFPYADKGTQEQGDWKVRLFPKTSDGKKRKQAIQDILKEFGYSQPKSLLKGITYEYFKEFELDKDSDVLHTYGCGDFYPNNIDTILRKMDEDAPEYGKGLNYHHSDEIIEAHDMPGMEEVFIPMIEKFLTKNINFVSLEDEVDNEFRLY